MPRAPKPKDIRQNTERVDVGDVPATTEEPAGIPPPLRSWLRITKKSWERYWLSPARHVTVASLDLDGLERLWTMYDERERAQRELRKKRIVIGSTGQERQSGFYTVIGKLDSEIRQLEDRVGKSAKSRLILGMRVGGGDAGDGQPDEDAGATRAHESDDEPPDPRIYHLDRRTG